MLHIFAIYSTILERSDMSVISNLVFH